MSEVSNRAHHLERHITLIKELRASHAGETGAVYIYRGILRFCKDEYLRDFALHHLETETKHLTLLSQLLPPTFESRLLPLWRLAGYLTGALPALFGTNTVYRTIQAVETFVEAHYLHQLSLEEVKADPETCAAFRDCLADEIAHKDEAAQLAKDDPGPLLSIWLGAVSTGSKTAVQFARRM
jgi:ubiquinone biosynthesis monooxygenase Coq7